MNFERYNHNFWLGSQETGGNIVLVEVNKHPVINHANAIVGKIVAQALGLRIGWYRAKNKPLMRSYSDTSEFYDVAGLNVSSRISTMISSLRAYLGFLWDQNKILGYEYDGIKYGDFIYDNYLSHYKKATLHLSDPRIIWVIYLILTYHKQLDLFFSQNPTVRAVVVSHHIGMMGVLTRVSLNFGVPVYWKSGGEGSITIAVFKSLADIYDYPIMPRIKDLEILSKKLSDKQVNSQVSSLIEDFSKGVRIDSSKKAYGENRQGLSKNELISKYSLEDKPIAYLMMHIFNDFPHSHFGKMLFRDYHDWFIQTFRFAVKDRSKNWLVKEHPYSKLYPTNDFNLDMLSKNLPSHVKIVRTTDNFSTGTVVNTADLLITCLGTIGIEYPVFTGKMAVLAGKSAYSGLGLSLEPKTISEYFSMLKTPPRQRLNSEQIKKAKITYLFIKRYSCPSFAIAPRMTVEDVSKLSNDPEDLKIFYKKLSGKYKSSKNEITKQMIEYINQVRQPDFYRLLEPKVDSLLEAGAI